MTREEHHARLRELGMGWLVDEVESRPGPHVTSARKETYDGLNGVRLIVSLTPARAPWAHRALSGRILDEEIVGIIGSEWRSDARELLNLREFLNAGGVIGLHLDLVKR